MSSKEDELVRSKGDWSSHDDKGYRGKLDRDDVAFSEEWEVEYFIDHWLETRVGEKAITNGNRNKVVTALEGYEGKTPYKRDALNAYLDKHFNKSAPKPSKP